MAQATVMGADGSTVTIAFSSATYAAFVANIANGTPYTTYDAGISSLSTASSLLTGGGTAVDTSGATDQAVIISTSDPVSFVATSGGGVIVAAGSGSDTFNLAGGDWTLLTSSDPSLVLLGTGSTSLSMGGADTVVAGSGPTTVYGAADSQVVMGTGTLLDVAGAGSESVVGSATGFATIFGTDGSDLQFIGGGDNNTLIAGGGSETLDGSLSGGSNIYFGGTGSDLLVGGGGNDVFVAGLGSDTFTGGAGGNLFEFADIASTSTDVITDFSAEDTIALFGGVDYTASVTATGVQLLLTDGVKIELTGLTSIDPSQILK